MGIAPIMLHTGHYWWQGVQLQIMQLEMAALAVYNLTICSTNAARGNNP